MGTGGGGGISLITKSVVMQLIGTVQRSGLLVLNIPHIKSSLIRPDK